MFDMNGGEMPENSIVSFTDSDLQLLVEGLDALKHKDFLEAMSKSLMQALMAIAMGADSQEANSLVSKAKQEFDARGPERLQVELNADILRGKILEIIKLMDQDAEEERRRGGDHNWN